MLTFTKEEATKYISEESNLIPRLLADGWKCEDIKTENDIDALKKEADALGITYSHQIGYDTLKKRIEDYKNDLNG